MITAEDIVKKIDNCMESIKENIPYVPKTALVLGSGLGDYADGFEKIAEIPYGDIKGFPVSTVAGHKGKFVFAYVGGVPTVMMQGRVHWYEGYEMSDVVLPVRLMRSMGAETLILTNAAGGVNFSFSPGDLMLITDQISSFVPSPLRGENPERLGLRFPDMSEIYNKQLCDKARKAAKLAGVDLKEGVYLQTAGPAYESPAEIKMFRALGADAVGMSTAVEAIAANHMGMKICGISCISNLACGMTDKPLTHEEVKETADRTAPLFRKLITGLITEIG